MIHPVRSTLWRWMLKDITVLSTYSPSSKRSLSMMHASRRNAAARLPERRVRDESTLPPETLTDVSG